MTVLNVVLISYLILVSIYPAIDSSVAHYVSTSRYQIDKSGTFAAGAGGGRGTGAVEAL